jgi:hypothetical protein
MIKDYHDDVIMAEYGRICAKHRAIREAKESIRDNAVRLGNSLVVTEIKEYLAEIVTSSNNLIDAIEMEEPCAGS